MSLLGKYTKEREANHNLTSDPIEDKFFMPAVTREDDDGSISLKKGLK